MTCRELHDFLAAYLDHELPPEQLSEFERHLRRCPPCVRYLDTYRKTIEICRAAVAPPVHEPIPEKLVRAILAARAKVQAATPEPPADPSQASPSANP